MVNLSSPIWQPYTQMKGAPRPIGIERGEGAVLYTNDGRTLIDAISSWWVNIHGHGHPYLADAISEQARRLEHVIFAGFTHAPAENLTRRLLEILPENQEHLFFSDNGSTAVEVAIKMAIQAQSRIQPAKTRLMALENGYHGDTFGAMSVSGRSVFTKPFNDYLFDVTKIPVPIKGHEQLAIETLKKALKADDVAAFIFEPLIQGTAGMVIYDADILSQMIKMCRDHQVLTIADEVMTGFGRTGTLFASHQLSHLPDIICLSKGLTGGSMPLAVTTVTADVYQRFLSDDPADAFFHGHSYCGNPLGCAAALASLDLLLDAKTIQQIDHISRRHKVFAERISDHKSAKHVRSLGTILAIEIEAPESGYLSRVRHTIYQHAISEGVLLRPLGNVLYTIPPYCITDAQLDRIYDVMQSTLDLFIAER